MKPEGIVIPSGFVVSCRARDYAADDRMIHGDCGGYVKKLRRSPWKFAELACEAGRVIHSCHMAVKPAVRSDLTVGMIMAIAAADAGIHTLQVNLKSQTNQQLNEILLPRITKTARSLEELRGAMLDSAAE